MTEAKSPLTEHEMQSAISQLPAALALHLGHSPTLQYFLRHSLPLTANAYMAFNHHGEGEDELDDGDLELIDALRAYEASQRTT